MQCLYAFYWNYSVMSNEKLKVGDNVKIIDCSSIEPYELNKVGIIVEIRDYDDYKHNIYVVDMGRPRRPDDNETCWYLYKKHIELVSKPNEQLLFEFYR